jgi:hypothetical protein
MALEDRYMTIEREAFANLIKVTPLWEARTVTIVHVKILQNNGNRITGK